MSAAATSLRVVSALRAGAVLVARPRGVVHLHTGAVTKSGRAVPAAARPLCGAVTRRLYVGRVGTLPVDQYGVSDAGDFTIGPRRLCRTCVRVLPRIEVPVELAAERALFEHLTVHDFARAAAWCRTSGETYQVGRLLRGIQGGKPSIRTTNLALYAAHEVVLKRRAHLTAAERTADERAALRARRDAVDDQRLKPAATGPSRTSAPDGTSLVGDGTWTPNPTATRDGELVQGWLTVPTDGESFLVHTEEHSALGIGPGTYEIRRQREYAGEWRRVAD